MAKIEYFLTHINPILITDIENWQKNLEIKLPDDYILFLQKNGNCISNNLLFSYVDYSKTYWPSAWLGIKDLDAKIILACLEDSKTKNYYPLVSDMSGAFAYISLNKYAHGSIYVSNWDDYDEEKEEYQKFKVADSFTEFINGLMTEEEAIAKGLL